MAEFISYDCMAAAVANPQRKAELLAVLEEAEYALRKAANQYEIDKGRRSSILDGRLEMVRQAIARAKEGL